MENIKLVIWDLDETFWKGTLSEEKIEPIESNVELVKSLVNRGIMNSIVSKNDYEKAKKELKELGIWDYFIFPQISWNPKGETVKKLLQMSALRPANTLFIDDNTSNLAEVEFYNKGINTALPEILQDSLLTKKEFIGKDDSSHSRLNQYKNLEKRKAEESKFTNNTDFLRSSGITISINTDCSDEKERILELIGRTNQLNFTKVRLTSIEFENLLKDKVVSCAYIRAADKFGDYGIVGFYAIKENKLMHFLFSCRVLGLGIDNYIYNKLGCPELKVVGEVASELNKNNSIDWIREETADKEKCSKKSALKVLMVSGCDLEQADFYLSSQFDIDKEFATVIDGKEIRTSDLTQLVNSYRLSSEIQEELCQNIPFFNEHITFKTKLFSGNYDYIILSVVDDYIRGLYECIGGGYSVSCFGYYDQDERLSDFTENEKKYLSEHFEYKGAETKEYFEGVLTEVLQKITESNSKTKIMLLNGIDLDVSEWIGSERVQRNIEFNLVVDKVIKKFSNVSLIDMRNIVTDKKDCIKKDNRHFSRITYYKMAEEIAAKINSDNEDICVRTSSRKMKLLCLDFKNFVRRCLSYVKHKILRL